MNPERISMPDIDIVLMMERDTIIKWVIEKYGQMNVAQIIILFLLGKSRLKMQERVLDVSIPDTNTIAKLIPETRE